jgi:L-fuconate dehydratase
MIEFVDHFQEVFATPVDGHSGFYWPPSAAGAESEMLPHALTAFVYPGGQVWSADADPVALAELKYPAK